MFWPTQGIFCVQNQEIPEESQIEPVEARSGTAESEGRCLPFSRLQEKPLCRKPETVCRPLLRQSRSRQVDREGSAFARAGVDMQCAVTFFDKPLNDAQ